MKSANIMYNTCDICVCFHMSYMHSSTSANGNLHRHTRTEQHCDLKIGLIVCSFRYHILVCAFNPSEKVLVSWDYYSQSMLKNVPHHQPELNVFHGNNFGEVRPMTFPQSILGRYTSLNHHPKQTMSKNDRHICWHCRNM